MKAGAFDFIEKPFRDQILLELVQKAIGHSIDDLRNGAAIQEIQQDFGRLTAREREVLDCVVAGEPNKRIAHTLGMSEKTVEYHRANIMKKTRARSLADLIKKALRVPPPAPNH
jgi:FixJ family two-component response regulator